MTRVTIGELKALIANLPDDFVLGTDSPDIVPLDLQVWHPDYPSGLYGLPYSDLSEMEPLESPADRTARLDAIAAAGAARADRIRRLLNPPEGTA